jgi:hypothetical protein
MNSQERQLIDELFEKLSRLEDSPRDADAVAAIAQAQRRAPNAVYALVQTVLVQDEALKRAHARIQDLESGGVPHEAQGGGFLDTMRDALFSQNQARGSVPPAGGRPTWNSGQVIGQPQDQYRDRYAPQQMGQPVAQPAQAGGGGGGSFLGTAAAAAAGVVGGGMLLSSIRGMMGGGHQQGFGDSAGFGGDKASPWSAGDSKNDLARDAGVNDIGSGGRGTDDSRSGFFDSASNDTPDDDSDFGDDGFDGGGDSDYA